MIFYIDDIPVVIEDRLAKKLDVMCDRVMKKHPTLDACLENSGAEGEGKTNVSIIEAAYIKMKTGRTINLFIKTSSAAKFIQNNKEGLVILDEPSFETLSTDFMTAQSKDLLRLTSTMRVQRTFLIINFAKFWKFPEFLVVDRALGMVHLYSRNGKEPGRFFYIRKKNLEKLWNDYKRHGERNFNKYKSFGGRFSYMMEKLFDKLDITVEGKPHATLKDYEDAKQKAISSIGGNKIKKNKELIKLLTLRKRISMLKGIDQEVLAQALGVSSPRIREWKKIDLDNPNLYENDSNEDQNEQKIDNFSRENEFSESNDDTSFNTNRVSDENDSKNQPDDPEDEDNDDPDAL